MLIGRPITMNKKPILKNRFIRYIVTFVSVVSVFLFVNLPIFLGLGMVRGSLSATECLGYGTVMVIFQQFTASGLRMICKPKIVTETEDGEESTDE